MTRDSVSGHLRPWTSMDECYQVQRAGQHNVGRKGAGPIYAIVTVDEYVTPCQHGKRRARARSLQSLERLKRRRLAPKLRACLFFLMPIFTKRNTRSDAVRASKPKNIKSSPQSFQIASKELKRCTYLNLSKFHLIHQHIYRYEQEI